MRNSTMVGGDWILEYSLRVSDIAVVLVQYLFGANWYTHCLVKKLIFDIFKHCKTESAASSFSPLLFNQMETIVANSNFFMLSFVEKLT